MTSTFATRTRSFTCPHQIADLQAEAINTRKQFVADRKTKIAELIKSASPEDKDEFYWTMIYDLEMAPKTTGRAQLLESGIVPVPPQELLTYDCLHDELWTIIEALSKAGIYLINTDHLSDCDLYARLYYRILDEPCQMLPPDSECVEYIDVLHPMDTDFPLGQALLKRGSAICNPGVPYKRGPICNLPGVLCTRDIYLPART
jgi:hypothetical protein